MGTSTPVQQKGTPLPTQQTAPTQQAPTQQSGKGAAPTQQLSKDTFQAPTQAQKGVAVPKGAVTKGAVTKGATQGACETSSTAPTSTEGCTQRVEDRTKHFFAGLRSDLSGLGSEIEGAIDNLEHMCGDFAGHVKGLLTKDTKTTSAADCSGGTVDTTATCSTQGTQAQAQAQFGKGGKGVVLPTQQAPVQQSKGAPVKGAPTQQAPVQQSKGAPVQQAPVQQTPTKGAPTQQAPVQKGGK